MLGFMNALLERIGATRKPFEEDLYVRTRGALARALGEGALEAALADGAGLRPVDAVGLGQVTA